jgi:D-ribose pyranose/furanose isomerase RbsD
MSEELEVLKMATQRLNESDILYMISGSIAANYYTVPRMTRDIDIVIELKEVNIEKFVNLFQNDFYVDKEVIKKEVSRNGMFNLIHKQYVVKVDFILSKESEFQNAAFARRKKVSIENSPMLFITAEDLILAKLIWAKDSYSEVQLKDVSNLLKSGKDLDQNYIKEWVATLNLNQIYKVVKRDE